MHDVTVKWIFFLLLVMAGKAAMAEGITSPMETSGLILW